MRPLKQYKVLVIDDEPRLRQVCRRVLEPQGLEVAEAVDGVDGLKAISEQRPDLVLVDLMMPNMDGMEVLARARNDYPDLSFVVITGFATLEKAVDAMKQGADDFLAKPFKPQELRLVVERVLKRVRTLDDVAFEKSRCRLLVNSMSNGVLVVNTLGKVALVNPILLEMIGWQKGDPRGMDLEEVAPCLEVIQTIQQIISGESQEKQSCQVTLGSDDSPLHLQVDTVPFLDGRENLVGAMAIFEDVSAWRRLDELKSEYVSTVAHDIASPLGSVISQLDTLEKGLAGDLNEKQAHLIHRARLRVQGIVDLSRDILGLAKMESGARDEPEDVDLNQLLAESIDLYRTQAEENGQTLTLSIPQELPPVKGLPLMLGQVFNNLLSNALRYTPESGKVEVTAGVSGGFVEVRVKDNGFGIAPEDHERIFTRFYRVKNADTRMIVGTGLGLPIVKKVVDEMGGQVELQSQLGQGSTFIVRLPV